MLYMETVIFLFYILEWKNIKNGFWVIYSYTPYPWTKSISHICVNVCWSVHPYPWCLWECLSVCAKWPVQAFLSFAVVKLGNCLEWPLAAAQNDTSWLFFWEVATLRNTYGVPQHANLRLLLCVSIDWIKWDQRLLDYPWASLDLVSAYPCTVLEGLPDLCRCRINRISRVRICFPFMAPKWGQPTPF